MTAQRSILAHLEAHEPADGGPGLAPGGYRLPDELPVADGEIRWGPGALRGVMEWHTVHRPAATDLALLPLVRAARQRAGGRRARARLYELARESDSLDPLSETLTELAADQDPRDRATGQWLAFEGRHRGPVRLGIALLALGHDEEDRRRMLLLARHDEFSSAVLSTLAAVSGDRGSSAYAVARVACGWGRVGAIDRLDLREPEVRRWLVCGGYLNQVGDGYTAINAAHADLLGQLRRIQLPDDELVVGAVGVVRTLLEARVHGGPSSDIDDYADAVEVIELLLELLDPSDFRRYQLAHDVRDWLTLPPEEGEEVIRPEGWRALLDQAEEVLADPLWRSRTEAALAQPGHESLRLAVDVGRSLSLDIFPAVFAALLSDPDPWWWDAATSAGPQRIESVVRLAEQRLVREEHDEYGALLQHQAIYVIQRLPGERPGLGWPLVEAALRSRQSDRWSAYGALERWGRPHWPEDAEPLLRALAATSTYDLERQRLTELLQDGGTG